MCSHYLWAAVSVVITLPFLLINCNFLYANFSMSVDELMMMMMMMMIIIGICTKSRTTVVQQDFSVSSPLIWNSLPVELQTLSLMVYKPLNLHLHLQTLSLMVDTFTQQLQDLFV